MSDNYWTRRVSRRRLLHGVGAVAGASALGAFLAACGGSNSGSGSTSSSSAGATATTAAKANPVDAVDLTGQKVQVELWHHLTGSKATSFGQIVDAFNSSQNNVVVKADNQGNSYDDLYKKVITAAAGGGLPDISEGYPNQFSDYEGSGNVVVLDDYINSTKYGLSQAEQSDFIKTYWDESVYPEYHNQHLSFPFSKSFLVTYFNSDKLKTANVAKTPDQWTWDDFSAAAKAMTSGGTKGWVIDIDPSTFDAMIFTRGGKLISDDQKMWLLNQQQGVDSLAFHEQGVREGWGYQWTAPSSLTGEFGNGKAALMLGSSSSLAVVQQQVSGGPKFNWNIAMIPRNAGLSPVTVLYGASLAIFKSNPQKQLGAWMFLKYVTSTDVTAKWALATGYTPVRQSAVQSDAIQQAIKTNPQFGVLLNQVAPYGKTETSVHGTQDTRNYIQDAMTQALLQPNTPAKTLMDTVVQKGNQALAQG